MNKGQLVEEIYSIYDKNFSTLNLFRQALCKIKNEYTEDAFIFASLRLKESLALRKDYPEISNLLCYIAVEALSNNIAYFLKTKGVKHAQFKINYKIEKSINKTQEFINFLDEYCPDNLKSKVIFKKEVDGEVASAPFKDVLRYLYQKNRSYIVHKGIFRNYASLVDVFIDEHGNDCGVWMRIIDCDLSSWLYDVVQNSFLNFLFKNSKN